MEENYSKLVDIAYNMHVSGKLEEAEDVYKKLISINPDDVDVLNLYAQLNVSLKKYELAIELFKKVYDKTGIDEILLNIAKVYFNIQDYKNAIKSINMMKESDSASLRILAMAYKNNGNIEDSINTYLKIYLNNECTLTDLLNLSLLYKQINDFENALKYGKIGYEADNNNLNINLHLASIYGALKDNENELKHLLVVNKQQPNIEIMYRIGVLYKQLNEDKKATEYFNLILQVNPHHKKSLQNLAMIYNNHDKKVTVDIFKDILSREPDDENTLVQLYITYHQMLDTENAYKIALELNEKFPQDISYKTFLGDELINLGKYQEALDIYNAAKNEQPDDKYINIQIGYIYSNMHRGQEAIEIFKKYIEPDGINQDLVFTSLREKNLQDVREFLYRHLNKTREKEDDPEKKSIFIYKLGLDKNYNINEHTLRNVGTVLKKREDIFIKYREKGWHFNDITNKRILIYSPNGVGDAIMFSRYIPDVKKMASEVILEIPNSFIDLFKYNFPDLKIYEALKTPLDENLYDYSTSFFSLIANLNIDLHHIESKPYLSIPDNAVEEKAKFDFMKTNKKKVGLFWQGNPMIMINRSVKLKQFLPLFERDDLQMYSFQISNFDGESIELKKELPIIDLSEHINNYSDTAAFLKNIDVLVTIDTSIANLAGAMGIKTFLLLSYDSEWRWFYDTEKTPWYDSVTIFKQTTPMVWDDVIERVKNAL